METSFDFHGNKFFVFVYDIYSYAYLTLLSIKNQDLL